MSAIIQRYFSRFTIVSLSLILLGIAIYLLDPGQTSTAQSDPTAGTALLQSRDIGPAVQSGIYQSLPDDLHTVVSHGIGVDNRRDGFHFAYRAWEGDGEFIVRVDSLNADRGRAQAGIMVREGLEPGSRHAFVGLTESHGVHFYRRIHDPGATTMDDHRHLGQTTLEDRQLYQLRFKNLHPQDRSTITQVDAPRWLRIVRVGEDFYTFDSPDGLTWDWLGTESIPMADAVFVGLAVSARDPAGRAEAVFSNLSVQSQSDAITARRSESEASPGTGDGLRGEYFSDRGFENPVFSRIDSRVNFVWWHEAPAESMPRDHFSIRWEGLLEAQYTEPYLIHLISDNQASLWLDGRLLIDDWFDHGATQTSALVNLEAGKKYHIRIDYSDSVSHAMVSLGWSSPSTKRVVIPQSQLYSELPDTDNDQLPDAWERAFNIEPGQAVPAGLRQAIETAEGNFAGLHGTTARPMATLLDESYRHGKHPGGLAGRPKAVDQAPGWISVDLSPAGPDGTTEALGEAKRQRVTATTARYGEVNGRSPVVTRDKFHFSHRLEDGNQELIARVVDLETAPEHTLGGVMVRASLDPSSPFVAVMVSPSRESWILCRTQKGHGARMQRLGVQAQWVKLQRSGAQVRLFESTDGTNWRWLGHEPFVSTPEVYYGVAAQGTGMADQTTVEFDDISLTPYTPNPRAVPPMVGAGQGLNGLYVSAAHAVERIDPTVDFHWASGLEVIEGLDENDFSVTWTGELQAEYSEIYCFEIACDDGARLWLDGMLLVDDWNTSPQRPRSVRVELVAGRRYPIRFEFYEAGGDAAARLRWSSPSTVKQVIPQTQLYSNSGAATFSLVGRGDGLRRPLSPDLAGESDDSWMGPPAPNDLETTVESVQSVPLDAFQNPLGQWEMDEENGGLVCRTRRGAVEFDFQVPEAAMYLIEVTGEAAMPHPDPNYLLWFDVDGQHLSRRLLTGLDTKTGQQLTPWLNPGTHRLRLFWDNSLPHRQLRLRQIDIKIIRGPDTDDNQISDWMEAELARTNDVDSASESAISPATVEGQTLYPDLMAAQAGGGGLLVSPGAGRRWALSLPLDPDDATSVALDFENGGRQVTHQVTWTPTDLTQVNELLVRQGDALLLSMGDGSPSFEGNLRIGTETHPLPAGATLPYTFNQPGTVLIEATWFGGRQLRFIRATVVAPPPLGSLAALVGHWREWAPDDIPDGAVWDPDPALELGPLATPDGHERYRLRTNDPITRYIQLRLGEGGPILHRLPVEGFRLDVGSRTGPARVVAEHDDGSRHIEVDVIMTPVRSEGRLVSSVAAGGILFATGQIREEYTAAVFDELGMMAQTFYQSELSKTSVCHRMDAYQGTEQLNEF